MRRILSALLVCLGLACGSSLAELSEVPLRELPPEAAQTLQLIDRNGPFPHRRDGITFKNLEQLLPQQARGFYSEYTVPTPGIRNRGARRIVTGGKPVVVYYYTDNHYRSFRKIRK
jgi:guanyl-specific ribonuclease Sa